MPERAASRTQAIHDASIFTDFDIYLFKEGNHFKLYEKFGSHLITIDEVQGTYFAVWAPNAEKVSVKGDFNGWNTGTHPLIRTKQYNDAIILSLSEIFTNFPVALMERVHN